MTSSEFGDRLSERARLVGVPVAEPVQQQFGEYFRLLAHWNSKINLTALPLDPPTDETFDRLLVEPLVAAKHVPDSAKIWLDLGSGGGSPAIPLKILRPSIDLTMVEARARKAAFLREAARTLRLSHTAVENARFEELASRPEFRHKASLVTVRAIKADDDLFAVAHALLARGGRLLMFRSNEPEDTNIEGFQPRQTICLLEKRHSYLLCMEPTMFHVEQTD
jgi:16S rRNA (guanine527-N7)-methyltransferase